MTMFEAEWTKQENGKNKKSLLWLVCIFTLEQNIFESEKVQNCEETLHQKMVTKHKTIVTKHNTQIVTKHKMHNVTKKQNNFDIKKIVMKPKLW